MGWRRKQKCLIPLTIQGLPDWPRPPKKKKYRKPVILETETVRMRVLKRFASDKQ